MDTDYIFVYGTLRPPQADVPAEDTRYYPAVAQHIQSHQPASLSNATLYDLDTYPAAVSGGGSIQGDLLLVDVQALPITDRIEGHPNFYKRARVRVQTADDKVDAWIYWAPLALIRGRRHIINGDWFQRNQDQEDIGMVSTNEQTGGNRRVASPNIDPTLRALVVRFAESPCSWLSTVRPNGRAHSSPIWHIWYQGRAYIVTKPGAVKSTNTAENPSVVITHPDPHSPVIIEGWATAADSLRTALQPHFNEKYDWDISAAQDYGTVLEITPTKLMAWGEHGEGRWQGVDVMQVWL